MKFEFAKYTEITDYVFNRNPYYKKEKYVRFFICPDVNDFWFVRILKGYNKDYELDENSYILERNNIPKEYKSQKLNLNILNNIIDEDDGSNWDYQQSYNLNDLIDMLCDGFGINNLKQ